MEIVIEVLMTITVSTTKVMTPSNRTILEVETKF